MSFNRLISNKIICNEIKSDEILFPNNFDRQLTKLTTHIQQQKSIISHLYRKVNELSKQNTQSKLETDKKFKLLSALSNNPPNYTQEQITRANSILSTINISLSSVSFYLQNLFNGVYLQLTQNPTYNYYQFSINPGIATTCFYYSGGNGGNVVFGNPNLALDVQTISPVLKPNNVYNGQIISYGIYLTYSGNLMPKNNTPAIPFQFDVFINPFSSTNVYPTSDQTDEDYKIYISNIVGNDNNLVFDTQSVKIGGSGDQYFYNNVALTPDLQYYKSFNNDAYYYYQDYQSHTFTEDDYKTTVYKFVWNPQYMMYDIYIVFSWLGSGASNKTSAGFFNWEVSIGKGNFNSSNIDSDGNVDINFQYMSIAEMWDNQNGLVKVNTITALPLPYGNHNIQIDSSPVTSLVVPLPGPNQESDYQNMKQIINP